MKNKYKMLIGLLQPLGLFLITIFLGWNNWKIVIINLILIFGFGIGAYFIAFKDEIIKSIQMYDGENDEA